MMMTEPRLRSCRRRRLTELSLRRKSVSNTSTVETLHMSLRVEERESKSCAGNRRSNLEDLDCVSFIEDLVKKGHMRKQVYKKRKTVEHAVFCTCQTVKVNFNRLYKIYNAQYIIFCFCL